VGGIALVFSTAVFVFREQVFSAFVADPSVLALGVTIMTAQLVAMVANGLPGRHHLGADRNRGHLFLVGVGMWFAARRAIDRGPAEGSPQRAEEVLEQAEA
jgi:multidrug efflux pump